MILDRKRPRLPRKGRLRPRRDQVATWHTPNGEPLTPGKYYPCPILLARLAAQLLAEFELHRRKEALGDGIVPAGHGGESGLCGRPNSLLRCRHVDAAPAHHAGR